MDVTPIDLHSRHPGIREQDFLQLDEEENREKWDLISLSLVVNFVPEPKDRGEQIHGVWVYEADRCLSSHRANATNGARHVTTKSISLPRSTSRPMRYWIYSYLVP